MRVQKRGKTSESKYGESVTLYSTTGLSIKDICDQTGVGFSAFSSYLCKHHRDLILKRHNLTDAPEVHLRGKRGQTTASLYKYNDAIAACKSREYIEYNISQIARIFDVNCSSLAGQLRRHYPNVIPRREQLRQQIGITENLQYGARKWTSAGYARAVEILKVSDMTIKEVARVCNVSYTGLREHIIAYHPQITQKRKDKRLCMTGQSTKGMRNGCWAMHEPRQSTLSKYEKAIELYRTTSLDVKEIARITQVNLGGFRYHLKNWHPELIVSRRGFKGVGLEQTKRYNRSAAEKYAPAIERLRSSGLPTATVAAEFGFKPEAFRMYLKEHCPELAAKRGMTKSSNGKTVSSLSQEKYSQALQLYTTTTESLYSIARKFGITYNSIGGYVRRNHPEAILRHNSLLAAMENEHKCI